MGRRIGIDLVSGRYFAPSAISLRSVLDATSYILSHLLSLRVSPRQLAALLGTLQWHCLLNRPSFSIFHAVYSFVRLEPQDVGGLVPKDVLLELLHFASIAPLLEADVCRPWADELIATDASPA